MKTLIKNAVILTMNPAMDVLENTDLSLAHGRIKALGSKLDDGTFDQVIEGSGKILMPGLINAHTHIAMSLFRGMGDDMPNRLKRLLIPLENHCLSKEMTFIGSQFSIAEMLLSGSTTFVDMYYFCDAIAKASKEMGMRSVVGQSVCTSPGADAQNIKEGFALFEKLYDSYKDDALVMPTIAPHSAYLNDDASLKQCAAYSQQYKIPLLMHIAEMEYEQKEYAKSHGSLVKYLDKIGILSERFIGAHGIYVDQEDIQILKNHGSHIAHCPAGNAKSGRPIAPISAYLENGVNVTLATDGPMSGNHMDLLHVMCMAPKMQKVRTQKRAMLPAVDVVKMATINAAKAIGMEKQLGSIEEGKKADILLINPQTFNMLPVYDYYSSIVYAMQPNNVEKVWVDGKLLVDNGNLVHTDEKQLTEDFLKTVDSIKPQALSLQAKA